MAYTPDPDRRPPMTPEIAVGLGLLILCAVLACFALPAMVTGALALLI